MTFAAQLTIGIVTAMTPTLAVFVGILLQHQDTRGLRNDLTRQMVDLRNQVHANLLMIHERVAKVEAWQG